MIPEETIRQKYKAYWLVLGLKRNLGQRSAESKEKDELGSAKITMRGLYYKTTIKSA